MIQPLLSKPFRPLLAVLCIFAFFGANLSRSAAADVSSKPYIRSIRLEDTNVVVLAFVPQNIRRVTLESRDRLGAGTWSPRAIARIQGQETEITFRLPRSPKLELLRLRTDSQEPLPPSFYTDKTSFPGGPGNDFNLAAGGQIFERAPTAGDANSTAPTREVVESDIWKISGDFVYFFNQYRGLQVIDHSQPDAPVVRGTYPLPAAGEQMYLLPGKIVALLARENCSWSYTGDGSQLLLLSTDSAVPVQIGTVPIPGYIQESRLVGNVLYVASQTYRPIDASERSTWEWGTVLSSFDLSDPAKPAARKTLWYSGYGNVISATDKFLFVASQVMDNWWRSVVRVIDISDPAGEMVPYATVYPAGRVPDKFKMNLNGTTFTVISEAQTPVGRLITSLETFTLENNRPLMLGSLQLGDRERLHATRFDGDRVYIVTFFQIDPLWIVDLSDPAKPRIAGELEVPGWSTYIEPLGDRLVAVGVETNRVTVSLFGVGDPAHPQLLSKVRLGENYSWSEANNDEKAFSVLPDANLILVPYQGDGTNGYVSRVQLLDLSRDSLTQRGIIEHPFQPRRATLHRDRILSISGRELLVVDAVDRDHPVVKADTDLAWPVNRVFLVGDFIVEIEAQMSWWGPMTPPAVRLARANDPDSILAIARLEKPDPIMGADVRNGRLFIAQENEVGFYPVFFAEGDAADPKTNNPSTTLTLSVFDLTRLPELPLLSRTEAAVQPVGWHNELEAVWPKEDIQVWSARGFYSFWRGPVPLVGGVADARVGGAFFRPWWGGGGVGRLTAFDVQASPKLVSSVTLSDSNRFSFSSAFAAAGKVFISHQASEYFLNEQTGQNKPDATGDVVKPIEPPIGIWVQKYFLDVVDYGDPANPVIRPPVNIPGTLTALGHDGELVYTTGYHWNATMNTDWSEWLDVSAYDGIAAHLVDSLSLSNFWPHPLAFKGDFVFLGRPASETTLPSLIETWTLDSTGRFKRAATTELKSPAQDLLVKGDLLVVTSDRIQLFNAADPTRLTSIGENRAGFCWGYDLRHGDGSVERGFWVPLGDYGVGKVP